MSETGEIHFEEVKVIFVMSNSVHCHIYFRTCRYFVAAAQKDWRYLKYASILAIAIPVVLGVIIGLNWEQSFVTFHHIFFNNDYWIFQRTQTPVITILRTHFSSTALL